MKKLAGFSAVVLICVIQTCVLALASDQPISKSITISTEHGNFVFTNVTYNGISVRGSVRNDTDLGWRTATFQVTLLDKDRKVVPTVYSLSLEVTNFLRRETKAFRTSAPLPGLSESHEVTDYKIVFDRGRSFYDSKYVFSLIKPKQSQALKFEDDTITMIFAISNQQLGFTMRNKTDSPISIDWNQVSYVDLTGTAHRVIHQGVKLIDRDKPQAQTVIPPTAKMVDFVYPADLISWQEGDEISEPEWIESPMLPPSQEAVHHKGETFGLFIPIEINGRKKNYLFTVKIVDVEI